MSPDSIEIQISDNPHAAGSAGSRRRDDEAARDGVFWRPQNPELSRSRPAHTRSDPPTSLTAPNSIFVEPLVVRSPAEPPWWFTTGGVSPEPEPALLEGGSARIP